MTETGNAYGNALYALAHEEGRDEVIGQQLEEVCLLLRENPDYIRLMSAPTVKKPQRLEILSQCFEGKVDEYLMNFMSILVENNTFEELESCQEAYSALYNSDHGIIEVTAATAVPLTDEQKSALSAKLSKETGKTVRLKNTVDPSCIGGVRLELNGRMLDGSVRARLDAIKNSLMTAKA